MSDDNNHQRSNVGLSQDDPRREVELGRALLLFFVSGSIFIVVMSTLVLILYQIMMADVRLFLAIARWLNVPPVQWNPETLRYVVAVLTLTECYLFYHFCRTVASIIAKLRGKVQKEEADIEH